MRIDLDFRGMPVLYKALNKKKELQVNFPGQTLKDLIRYLMQRFGRPIKEALLDSNGDIDMEIRVVLNRDNYLLEDRMATPLNDGDNIVFMGAS